MFLISKDVSHFDKGVSCAYLGMAATPDNLKLCCSLHFSVCAEPHDQLEMRENGFPRCLLGMYQALALRIHQYAWLSTFSEKCQTFSKHLMDISFSAFLYGQTLPTALCWLS